MLLMEGTALCWYIIVCVQVIVINPIFCCNLVFILCYKSAELNRSGRSASDVIV